MLVTKPLSRSDYTEALAVCWRNRARKLDPCDAGVTDGREQDHWHFDRGTPIRQVRKGIEYVKRGDRFGFFQDGKFIDTPRAALSR